MMRSLFQTEKSLAKSCTRERRAYQSHEISRVFFLLLDPLLLLGGSTILRIHPAGTQYPEEFRRNERWFCYLQCRENFEHGRFKVSELMFCLHVQMRNSSFA